MVGLEEGAPCDVLSCRQVVGKRCGCLELGSFREHGGHVVTGGVHILRLCWLRMSREEGLEGNFDQNWQAIIQVGG